MAEAKNPSLRELLALPVAVPVGAITLHIAPMGWYQGSAALEHLLPCMDALPLFAGADEKSKDELFGLWAGVIITHRDAIAAFCAEAAKLPIDEVRELPPGAMAELVVGLVEINLDFFVQSLPGLAQRARGRLAALSEKLAAAQVSSTSSSAS